jgi:hypothetical protein
MALHKSRKHWRALQHVDVIVRSRHVKEKNAKSKGHNLPQLQAHAAISMTPFVQTLPSKWTVVP